MKYIASGAIPMTKVELSTARSMLESKDSNELLTAIAAIEHNGDLSDLNRLIGLCNHLNGDVKKKAIAAATSIIKENLIAHYNDFDTQTREKLTRVMEKLDPQVLRNISQELFSQEDQRLVRAVQILGLMPGHPEVKKIMATLVQHRDEKIRATAINLLGKLIGPHDHEILMSLLNDEDKRVRANTVEALEGLGNKRLVPVLLRFRKDPVNRIRGNVLKALYTLGHTDIEKDLLEMLNSKDLFMRASAMWVVSMHKIASRPIIDCLGKNCMSANDMVRRNAKQALEQVPSPRCEGYLRYLGDIEEYVF